MMGVKPRVHGKSPRNSDKEEKMPAARFGRVSPAPNPRGRNSAAGEGPHRFDEVVHQRQQDARLIALPGRSEKTSYVRNLRFQAMRGKIRRYAPLFSAVGETSWRRFPWKPCSLLVRLFIFIAILQPICSALIIEMAYGALKVFRQYQI
jgi:hypothetical protein